MPLRALTSTPNARAFGVGRTIAAASASVVAATLLTLLTLLTLSADAHAPAPMLTVNGSAANVVQAERNNHVFVPARSVFAQLGEVVTYTTSQAVVKTKAGAELARMTLGSREATMKGAAQTLAAAPFAAHGTLMVPLRFVSEAAGARVAYSANPRAIDIHKAVSVAAAPAVGAQANPAPQATDAPTAAPAVATQADSGGIPWWVWLLAALVILGLILAFLRRKKEPIIATSRKGSGGDPTITTRH